MELGLAAIRQTRRLLLDKRRQFSRISLTGVSFRKSRSRFAHHENSVQMKLRYLFLTLCLGHTLYPATTEEPDPERIRRSDRYIDHASQMQEVGDYEGALQGYSEAIRINPKNTRAYVSRGRAKAERENHDGAIIDYSEALEIDPDYDPAYYERSRSRASKEDWEGALSDISEAIELKPNEGSYLELRGDVRTQRHLYTEAAEDFERLSNVEKQSPIALLKSAQAKLHAGDVEGAWETLNRAFKNRLPSEALTLRARLKVLKGLRRGALADYSRAIRTNPLNPAPLLGRGLLYYTEDDLTRARKDIVAALPKLTSEETRDYANLWLWLIDTRSGDRIGASANLRTHRENRPPINEGDWYDAIVLYLLDELSESELFEAAIDSDPVRETEQSCEASFYAAQMRLIEHDLARAVVALNDCLKTGVRTFFEYQAATLQLQWLEGGE